MPVAPSFFPFQKKQKPRAVCTGSLTMRSQNAEFILCQRSEQKNGQITRPLNETWPHARPPRRRRRSIPESASFQNLQAHSPPWTSTWINTPSASKLPGFPGRPMRSGALAQAPPNVHEHFPYLRTYRRERHKKRRLAPPFFMPVGQILIPGVQGDGPCTSPDPRPRRRSGCRTEPSACRLRYAR